MMAVYMANMIHFVAIVQHDLGACPRTSSRVLLHAHLLKTAYCGQEASEIQMRRMPAAVAPYVPPPGPIKIARCT